MQRAATRSNDKTEAQPAKTAQATTRLDSPGHPADLSPAEAFLNSLARAVRQFHTYPATSPFCTEAIAACQKTLASIPAGERLSFRVTPHGLVVEGNRLGADTIVDHELGHRLHRVGVSLMSVDPETSARDLEQLCQCLVQCPENTGGAVALGDLLVERGVDRIETRAAQKAEVLELRAPSKALCDLAANERRRRDALFAPGASIRHLYPPDKGWVRLDPTATFDSLTLTELAVLVESPSELAAMLLRLTDDDGDPSSREGAALERKFSDVSTLFASLEPTLARRMFARLAHAVLDLEPERRKALLQRTVLPGLLDGRADGMVLHDFPDLDLAEALCLLLELETAAPEMLTVAFSRLDLPAERRRAVAPMLEARVQARDVGTTPGGMRSSSTRLDRYAERLIQIDADRRKSFVEFAAFDLAIDETTAASLARIGESIAATDAGLERLRCICSLVGLETSRARVEAVLGVAVSLLQALERDSRWPELLSWLARFRQLSTGIQQRRPQIAEAVSAALQRFCTPDIAMRVIDLHEPNADTRALADQFMEAVGPAIAPALAALVEDPRAQSKLRTLTQLMSSHARLIAPALVEQLEDCRGTAACTFVRVLGFAGPGYETFLARQVAQDDGPIMREALRALARIGTPHGAAVVATHIREGSASGRTAAEEALWHFSPELIKAQVRDLLGRHEFVVQNPEVVLRLLQRVARTGSHGIEQELKQLTLFRWRFWSPALIRVASTARQLLTS